MSYRLFLREILACVQERLPASCPAHLRKITKNNGLVYDALVIFRPGCNIAPAIDLREYYSAYLSGTALSEIVRQILSFRADADCDHSLMPERFRFDRIRERIVFRLVNRDRNAGLLRRIPHLPWQDLSCVFYYYLEEEDLPEASVIISCEDLKRWEIGFNELRRIAFENTPRSFPARILPMAEALKEAGGGEEMPFSEVPMSVLTSTAQSFGASAVCYPEILDEAAEKIGDDLFLLPSSIHEWILLPAAEEKPEAELLRIIREVNSAYVSAQDFLSNSLYRYHRKEQKVKRIMKALP